MKSFAAQDLHMLTMKRGGGMCEGRERRLVRRRKRPHAGSVVTAGIAMLTVGLLLIFLCLPGWAWAALTGLLLVVAGMLLIRAGGR